MKKVAFRFASLLLSLLLWFGLFASVTEWSNSQASSRDYQNTLTALKIGLEGNISMLMKINYKEMFDESQVDYQKLPEIENIAYSIRMHRGIYQEIESATQIPWYVIAAIHNLESSLNFHTHLHNGDPLTGRTVHVPRGRPYSDPIMGPGKPYTWKESAIDALGKSALWTPSKAVNWTVAQCLEFMERYNGLGYAERDLNTPYLWSGTNLYTKGLFVADDKFDPNAVSKEIGAVALLKVMALKGYIQTLRGDFL